MKLMSTNTLFGARRVRAARRWALALAAAVPGLASAGVADVLTTDVKALSTQVTYAAVSARGEPLVTYIGYELTTRYTGTNTTNNVELVGDLTLTDSAEVATLVFDSANSDPACSAQTLADRVRLRCVVGQLRQGSADKVFQVFFKAPAKVVNGIADDVAPAFEKDLVTLTGTTVYAEVSDGAGNTNNAAAWSGPAPVTLGTTVSDKIKSVLPKSGGKLFSGNAGIANGTDVLGSSVVVPAFDRYMTAEIVESTVDTATCTSTVTSTLKCYALDLTIKDGAGVTITFVDKLTIKISLDQSLVAQKFKVQDLTVKYEGTVVGPCPAAGVPLTNGLPCINNAVRVKDPKDPERNGDIDFEFLNYKNGRFSIG